MVWRITGELLGENAIFGYTILNWLKNNTAERYYQIFSFLENYSDMDKSKKGYLAELCIDNNIFEVRDDLMAFIAVEKKDNVDGRYNKLYKVSDKNIKDFHKFLYEDGNKTISKETKEKYSDFVEYIIQLSENYTFDKFEEMQEIKRALAKLINNDPNKKVNYSLLSRNLNEKTIYHLKLLDLEKESSRSKRKRYKIIGKTNKGQQ